MNTSKLESFEQSKIVRFVKLLIISLTKYTKRKYKKSYW